MAKLAITRKILKFIMDQKLKPLNRNIYSVIESINFWESKFDEMNKRIADVESSSAHILKENKLLKEEILWLSNSLQAEKETVSDLEQYIRQECLKITGIPQEMHDTRYKWDSNSSWVHDRSGNWKKWHFC